MNIILKPEQEKFVLSQINQGKFTNPDQVVDLAFRLLEKSQNDYEEWLEETRQKINIAIQELDNGERLDGETVVNEILEKLKNSFHGDNFSTVKREIF